MRKSSLLLRRRNSKPNKSAERRSFFKKRTPLYRKDPVLFAREVLQFEPDEWQQAALMDLANNPKVSIKSGQGVGKTGIEAVALLWFLACFPYPRVVATAPTKQQLHDVLWSEVSKWQERSPLLQEILKWTKTYIFMRGKEKRWFAVARTATKPENMQGFHEDNMLFIVDEASGVAEPIMEAILGTLSGENNKLLLCGNPTKTSGTFYDSHNQDRGLYSCHTVSSEDSVRTNKESIRTLIKKYGYDSNVVRVRVRGLFPKQEDDVFIMLDLIEQAVRTEKNVLGKRIALGVDVARYGGDETVMYENADFNCRMVENYRGHGLMETAGHVIKHYYRIIKEYPKYQGPIYINIDDCGLGGGVTDRLNELKRGEMRKELSRMVIVPVNAAEKVPDPDEAKNYENMSTYLWAIIRELMTAGILCLEDDNETVAQLSSRKYHMSSRGKIMLESKDDMKKRNLDSPDRADALALSLYEPKIFDISSLL